MAACVQWRAFSESDRYGVWYCLRGVVLRDVVPLVRRRRVPPKGHDPVAPVLKSSRFEVRAPAFVKRADAGKNTVSVIMRRLYPGQRDLAAPQCRILGSAPPGAVPTWDRRTGSAMSTHACTRPGGEGLLVAPEMALDAGPNIVRCPK